MQWYSIVATIEELLQPGFLFAETSNGSGLLKELEARVDHGGKSEQGQLGLLGNAPLKVLHVASEAALKFMDDTQGWERKIRRLCRERQAGAGFKATSRMPMKIKRRAPHGTTRLDSKPKRLSLYSVSELHFLMG